MEWELIKPWVNRLGIVLEFLSFWFAAPGILGEERLRGLERRVEQAIVWLPLIGRVVVTADLAAWVLVPVVVTVVVVVGLVAVVAWKAAVVLAAVVVVVVAWKAAVKVAVRLEYVVVRPLLRVLADDKRIRRRSLAVGAVLFVVGFL